MVEGIHETLRAKAIKRRVNVGLQRQHVGGGKFPARLEHAVNSVGAPRRIPFRADAVGILVGRDARICRGDDARRRIEDAGQLLERNVARPLMLVIGSAHRKASVTRGAQWNMAGRMVANVPVDVSVHRVLRGRVPGGEGLLEFIPVLG